MVRFVVALAFAVGLASQAVAGMTEVWKVTGLDTPESVAFDPGTNAVYVSSIGGEIMAKDRNGFISKVSTDGKMLEHDWLTGLNGPAGVTISKGKLYTVDVDELVEIDIASAKVLNRYKAEGGKFLNGVTSGDDAAVYASDTFTNTIWRLKDGKFEAWLRNDELNGPNGLAIEDDRLIVASFGQLPEGDKPGKLGTLISVSLKDKSFKKLRGGAIGNLDGLVVLAPGQYLATDWVKGGLYRIGADSSVDQVLDLDQGSAALTYLPEQDLIVIPMMKNGTLVAYRVE